VQLAPLIDEVIDTRAADRRAEQKPAPNYRQALNVFYDRRLRLK
jgi:hypothetical protein